LNGSEVAKQLDDPSNDRARYKGHPHGNGTGKAPSSKLKVNQEIFNGTAAKVVEPTRGRIWVCDVSHSPHRDRLADGIALLQVYEEQSELGSTFCKFNRPLIDFANVSHPAICFYHPVEGYIRKAAIHSGR